jgi:ABC-2 type transport system ATP-binding protein
MLKATSLVRSYGDFRAVDDVSFTIPAGQIVGLLGHNGAGKTTIMKMLSGYLEPDSGRVTMNDKEIDSDLQGFQAKLGYLPENLPVYQDMVVADYLDYAADLKGISTEDKLSEVKRVVQETGIQEKTLSPVSALSRGYKQRVGVAQALLGKPEILILDEPTNGLDPGQTEQMRALIREISKRATVILSTHIMQEVEALCDRVLILKAGRLGMDANLEELRKSREILFSTSLGEPKAKLLFEDTEGIEQWEILSDEASDGPTDLHTYRVTLKADSQRFEIGARLASKVAESGERIYELKPLVRDLETLVREIGGNVHRAA